MPTTSLAPFDTATSGVRRLFASVLRRPQSAGGRQPDLLNALIGGLTSAPPDTRRASATTALASREREHEHEHERGRDRGRGRENDSDLMTSSDASPALAHRVEASDPRESAPYLWAQAVAASVGLTLDRRATSGDATPTSTATPRAATPQTVTVTTTATATPTGMATATLTPTPTTPAIATAAPTAKLLRPPVWAQPLMHVPSSPIPSAVLPRTQAPAETPRHAVARAGVVALLAVLAASGSACRSADDPNVIRLNGRLEAPLVDIAPKVTGRVTKVLVREGDRVKAGDLLITLDLGETALAVDRDRAGVDTAKAKARDMEAGSRRSEISAAEADVSDRVAAVDLAKRELERQQFLLGRKVGTERDTDRAKTDLDRAQAALASSRDRLQLTREGFRKWQTEQARTEVSRAQVQLRQSETIAGEAELRAPADAVVLHRMAEPGLLLSAGQSGLTLAFADRLYVRTFVPETKLGQVKQGGVAEVTVDAFPGRSFPGRVTEISLDAEFTPKAVETRAERVNLVYAAKVDLDHGWKEPLVPGQPAEVIVRVQAAGAAATAQPASGTK
jgi:HlyD family secretion protein